MNLITRFIVVAGVAFGAYALSYWPSVILLSEAFKGHLQFLDIAPKVLALICAVAAGWVAWRKLRSADLGLFSHMLIGSLFFGFIGFSAGVIGVIIFTHDNNLAGLIPILYTGPLGVVFGVIVGFLYWFIRKQKHTESTEDQEKTI